MPKTEKELLVYFKLVELERLHKKTEENYAYMNDHFKQCNKERYEKAKNEYLKLVNE